MNRDKSARNSEPGLKNTPMRKTYGISGLTEITVAIPIGKAWINIQFSGGAITGYGVIPATFTTDNPSLQTLIERSAQFRNKRIKIVSRRAI